MSYDVECSTRMSDLALKRTIQYCCWPSLARTSVAVGWSVTQAGILEKTIRARLWWFPAASGPVTNIEEGDCVEQMTLYQGRQGKVKKARISILGPPCILQSLTAHVDGGSGPERTFRMILSSTIGTTPFLYVHPLPNLEGWKYSAAEFRFPMDLLPFTTAEKIGQ